MDAGDDVAVVSGDGGDQRGQAAHAAVVAVEQSGMEAQGREAAAREPAGAQVGFRVGAVDGAAATPQASRRFGGVVGVARALGRRSRPGEEGAGLVERRAKRRRVDAMADDVEQIAMLPRGRIGEFSGRARRREADEEGSAAPAVEVARDPVPAPASAVGQVSAADLLGTLGERGGDGGRVHGAHFWIRRDPAKPGPSAVMGSMRDLAGRSMGRAPVPASLDLLEEPGRRAAREARARRPARGRLGSGCTKMAGPAREGRGSGQGKREGEAR